MLTLKEQEILLIILRKEKIFRIEQDIIKSKRFYATMNKLENFDLIFKNIRWVEGYRKVEYRLTLFGKLVAMCLSKLPDTKEIYRNNKAIRWFYE